MSEIIKELFVVSKELGIRKARKIAKEQAEMRGVERNTPWRMSLLVEDVKNSEPKFFGDLWLSVLSHFSTGRDKLYYLFVVVTQ